MALTPGASTDSNTASTPESKLKMAEASDAPFMCLSARPVVPTTDTTSPRNMRNGRIQCSPPSKVKPSSAVQ